MALWAECKLKSDKQKVLITGGAGYLGSVMVGHLLDCGHTVTVLDNLLYGQTSLIQYANKSNFNFVFGDARDAAVLKNLLPEHEVIVPLAAIVGAKACDNDAVAARSTNFEAICTLNKLRSAQHKVIYFCTNSGYGTKKTEAVCTEETPLEPISLYGRSKVEAETEVLGHDNSLSLRLATVFGPSSRLRLDLLVNDFVYRAVSDRYLVLFEKDFKRNYIHIDDVAECVLFCLDNFDRLKGEAYNLGLNDANLSKEELALKIKEHVSDLYIHNAEVGTDPDKRNYVVSNTKINSAGFTARHTLDQGIQQLIKSYKMVPRAAEKNA